MELEAVLVTNKPLQTPANNRFVTSVRKEWPDIADHAEDENTALTAYIPLDALFVGKWTRTIYPRGEAYMQKNVGEHLPICHFIDQLRPTVVETGAQRPTILRKNRLSPTCLTGSSLRPFEAGSFLPHLERVH